MDTRDIEFITVIQREDVFLGRRPFEKAAELLGWDVEEVLARSKRLKDEGVIRRFGAALTPVNAGFTSNSMVAWDVPHEREDEVAAIMASHQRISHCYIRSRFEGFPYNLYTMMHAKSPEELWAIIEELRERTGITSCRPLHSLKEFKKSSPVYFAALARIF